MTLVWLILTLLCLPAWSYAATYWVSESGNNANTCTAIQSATPPANLATGSRRTLNAGVQCLAAGDTLYVRSGTYVEALEHKIPGGTSWNNMVTVAGYPGDTVTVRPSGGGTVLRFASSSHRYIEVRGMILDGVNVSDRVIKITWSGNSSNLSSHIRIRDSEIKNAANTGIGVGGCCNEFIGLKVHSNGDSKLDHGFYISTSNNLVEYCDVYQNSGYGVHIYASGSPNVANDNIVRYNRVFNNGLIGGAGILLSSGARNAAYNNVVYNNSTGVSLHYNASASRFYNNTIFNSQGRGIQIETGSSGAIVRNNISWGNGGSAVVNNGSGTTLSHNLCTGHASCVVTSNPLFINAGAGNFALQAGSPAINAGTSTITSGVTIAANDANPSIGAHQPIYAASGQAIDTDTVRINFTNNTFPPMLVTDCTGHTLEEDTGGGFASRTIGSCQNVGGGNQLVLSSITPALSADSTLRWSYATTGNISDSALFGGTNNQRLNAVSNFPIANLIEGGAAPPPVAAFTQTIYQFFAHNSSNGLLPLTDRNRDLNIVPDSTLWIRFQMENTGDDVDEAGYAMFWTDDNWDTETRLDNDTAKAVVSGEDKIQSGASTCVFELDADRHCAGAGFVSRPVGPVPAVTMSAIGTDFAVAEFQYSVKFRSGLTSGTYCFRLRHDSGAPLDIYNRTPCVQIGVGGARIR